jgi:galactonate dehydratase
VRVTALETLRLDEYPHLCYLRLHTDAGLVGLGETYYGSSAVAEHLHATVGPYLLGKNALDIERHWRALNRGPGIRSTGVEQRALSAVDIALWDLLGQASGMPIYQLLGGASRDRIRVYNTCSGYRHVARAARPGRPSHGTWGLGGPTEGPYEDYEATFERPEELAQSLLGEGITAMKIWPFAPGEGGGQYVSDADLDPGVAIFARIRQAVGMRIDIALDMVGAWSLPAALRIARAVEEFRPMWFEDPVSADDLDAFAEFRRATRVPVAGAEGLGGRQAFRELLAKGAVDIVHCDPSWTGGISEAKKIAAMAEAHHRPFAPHDDHGPVNWIVGVHLCINAPNAMIQEFARAYYHGAYPRLVTELPRVEAGYALRPDGPGLGTALRPEVFERPDAHVRRSEWSE